MFPALRVATGVLSGVLRAAQRGWGINPSPRWGNRLRVTQLQSVLPQSPVLLAEPSCLWPWRLEEQLWGGRGIRGTSPWSSSVGCCDASTRGGGSDTNQERARQGHFAKRRPQHRGGEAVGVAPSAQVARKETESWIKQLSHCRVVRKLQHRVPGITCLVLWLLSPPPPIPAFAEIHRTFLPEERLSRARDFHPEADGPEFSPRKTKPSNQGPRGLFSGSRG